MFPLVACKVIGPVPLETADVAAFAFPPSTEIAPLVALSKIVPKPELVTWEIAPVVVLPTLMVGAVIEIAPPADVTEALAPETDPPKMLRGVAGDRRVKLPTDVEMVADPDAPLPP